MKNLTLTIGLILLTLTSFGQEKNEMDLFVHKVVKPEKIVAYTMVGYESEKMFYIPKKGIKFNITEDKIVLKKKGKKLVIPYSEVETEKISDGESNREDTFFYKSKGDVNSILYKRNEFFEKGVKTTYSFTFDNVKYDFINFFPNGTPYKN